MSLKCSLSEEGRLLPSASCYREVTTRSVRAEATVTGLLSSQLLGSKRNTQTKHTNKHIYCDNGDGKEDRKEVANRCAIFSAYTELSPV